MMLRTRFPYPLFSLLLLFALTPACEPKEDQSVRVQAMVDQLVQDRIQSHKDIRLARCREEMLREAGGKVDSMLLEEARLTRDTLDRPPKPTKPGQPLLRTLPDSLRLVQKPRIQSPGKDTLQKND